MPTTLPITHHCFAGDHLKALEENPEMLQNINLRQLTKESVGEATFKRQAEFKRVELRFYSLSKVSLRIYMWAGLLLDNFTPLEAAIVGTQPETVDWLLENGADPKAKLDMPLIFQTGFTHPLLGSHYSWNRSKNPDGTMNYAIKELPTIALAAINGNAKILDAILKKFCSTDEAAEQIFATGTMDYFGSCFYARHNKQVNSLDIALKLSDYDSLRKLFMAMGEINEFEQVAQWIETKNQFGHTPSDYRQVCQIFVDTFDKNNTLGFLKEKLFCPCFRAGSRPAVIESVQTVRNDSYRLLT